MDNYYEILDVSHDAPKAVIEKAYKRLSKRLHPDKNSALNATQAFQLLGRAWDGLKDDSSRASHDRVGHRYTPGEEKKSFWDQYPWEAAPVKETEEERKIREKQEYDEKRKMKDEADAKRQEEYRRIRKWKAGLKTEFFQLHAAWTGQQNEHAQNKQVTEIKLSSFGQELKDMEAKLEKKVKHLICLHRIFHGSRCYQWVGIRFSAVRNTKKAAAIMRVNIMYSVQSHNRYVNFTKCEAV